MAFLETLASTAGRYTGKGLIDAMALIRRNFAKLEPSVVSSGAADYIPALTDIGKTILRTRATAQTLTLPKNATVAFPIGTRLPFTVTGAGTLTVQAESGATVDQGALLTLGMLTKRSGYAVKTSTNGWHVEGGFTLA